MTCRFVSPLLLAALCVCGSAPCGIASGQTTQPAVNVIERDGLAVASTAARNSWPGVVQSFIANLSSGEIESAWTLMGERARIDEFDPDAPATFARLVDLAKRTALLGVHPYELSPITLADDIAADVAKFEAMPEDIRKRMIPADEDEAARANATAAQWIALNLSAEKGQPLAAVVLWDATESQVQFILLKGAKVTTSPPTFQITHVVFGNPLAVPR